MPKKQSIITLTTDFDLYDGYVGVMKGVIANINPLARVIDISNKIRPHDVFQAACVINNSYAYFPKGTIHIVVVDPGVGSNRKIICLKTDDYLFLAPDNGVLSFIIEKEKAPSVREVTNRELFLKEISNTFHGRDIFAPVAAHLSKGQEFNGLGGEISKTNKIDLPKPIRSPDGELTAEVIYVDSFGNLVTNINREIVDSMNVGAERLSITMGRRRINGICDSYADVGDNEALVIFGSSGYLEISINRGNAGDVLRLKKGDKLVLGN
ncbi:MAG: SAM-dependent chlorinase/fluorinase [Candidatus Brocadiaceae bacterium]|nr:SAM-dependent chlorinase/fluorinase [Candidatus Brocadiaceae bacterium]